MVSTSRGIRQRVRDELTKEIKDVARRHLSEFGAPGLSVRAITRELGMASSAVYRYFPSRDALLTALIIDAYEGVGQAARSAESACARTDYLGRWLAVFRSVRGWALEHPHEYALIYGSPVPGYVAPQDTAAPAAHVAFLLAGVVIDVAMGPGLEPHVGVEPSEALRLDALKQVTDMAEVAVDGTAPALAHLDPVAVIGVIDAWTALFGAVSFELFGHYHRVVEAREDHLDRLARVTARDLGLPGA
jgi:AcrR family transcriptional regulator